MQIRDRFVCQSVCLRCPVLPFTAYAAVAAVGRVSRKGGSFAKKYPIREIESGRIFAAHYLYLFDDGTLAGGLDPFKLDLQDDNAHHQTKLPVVCANLIHSTTVHHQAVCCVQT